MADASPASATARGMPQTAQLASSWAKTVPPASTKRFARALLLPGLGLQRITTREPRLEETRVALRAVESVLSRQLAA